ncbi:hypothetical protein GCM10028805_52170 [Spirosoma harenae]
MHSPKFTYAISIGISRYDTIPSLQFAHRDAEGFRQFLKSPLYKGGELVDTIFQDTLATKFTIERYIKKFSTKAQNGDRFIVFFAGHGDKEIESRTGFLLTHDAQTNNYPQTAVSIDWLSKVISTILSEKREIEVWLIADACRSGEYVLAGDEIQGRYRVWEGWPKNITEITFLSCDAKELSLEDSRLDGGHGGFFLLPTQRAERRCG